MYYVQDEEISALCNLHWKYSAYFTVPEFLKKFSLPQLVKVVAGFYGDDEETSFSGNQLLYLHSIKSIEKVNGRDSNGREISVLAECKNKVEVRPSSLKGVYDSVKELCSAFPRHVRVSQGYYNPSTDEAILNVGDKLHLKSVTKSKNGKEKLICINQNGQTIKLPKDCKAGFQPLVDGKEYYLSEVLKKFTLPVFVQFVDPFSKGKKTPSENKSVCQPLGTISLQRKVIETVVIGTSIQDDGRGSTVTLPPEVDICLIVCEDMLRNSTDYSNLCQRLSHYTDFQNISPVIYEYVGDMNLSSKKLKLPNSNKSKSSKHDTKKGGKLTSFSAGGHSVGKTSRPSKRNQTDDSDQIYTETSGVYEEIDIETAECNKETMYTELDPTYIATTSHEYEKPLKQGEQLSYSNPVTLAIPNSAKQPANSSTPLRKLSLKRADDVGSNSRSYGGLNPSTLPENLRPPDNLIVPVRRSQIPDRPPQLPKRNAAPGRKPLLPDGYSASPEQPLPESFTIMHDGKTVSSASPPKLPHRPIIPDKVPALPTSSSDKPPPLPSTKMPVTTPASDGDEIHQEIAKFPSDLSGLSVADVSRLLKDLGMESCVEIFKAELVDGDMLASMDKESLDSLGISAFHVKKLVRFIGGWRPNVQ